MEPDVNVNATVIVDVLVNVSAHVIVDVIAARTGRAPLSLGACVPNAAPGRGFRLG